MSGEDLWLTVLAKKGEVTFEDIKKVTSPPHSLGDVKFGYVPKTPHAVFHLILNDLDALCGRGLAVRAYEKEKQTGDIVEKFRITRRGAEEAERIKARKTEVK